MPYINVSVSKKINDQEKTQLKAKLGEVIELIPGKEEESTMVKITDDCALYMGGKALSNGSFIDVRIYGTADLEDRKTFIEALFKGMEEVLGIAKEDLYVNFFEMLNWGVKGTYV